ncbi:MAG TPA: TonB family protein [Longimicrobium sp.]|nr:TonB family protein [Longimicrobium sp.]
MDRMRSLATLALALAAAQGCASSGAVPRESLLADGRAPRETSCRVGAEPEQLPTAGELVNVEAFRGAAAGVWTRAGQPAGHVLFSVRHAADGVQVRRAVIESSVPDAVADTLQKLMFAHRLQTPAARQEWGVRVRVDLGEQVALRVGRREECTPRPRDWEYRTAGNPFDVREGSAWPVTSVALTDQSVVWVRVRLNERGSVTDALVERAPNRPLSEQRVLDYVRTLSFFPATEDGYPVPGELTLPVRLALVH